MTSDPSDYSSSTIAEVVERICRRFETAWHSRRGTGGGEPRDIEETRDHFSSYRIEDLLPELPGLLAADNLNPTRSDVLSPILAELIHVEMDLRCSDRQRVDPAEYYRRFPDFGAAIDASWNRICQKWPERRATPLDPGPTVSVVEAGVGGAEDLELDQDGHEEIPETIGPYRNIHPIGEGGFGIVCQAVDSRNRQPVALKFPLQKVLSNRQPLRQFCEEAQRALRLDHPGIVKTLAVESIEGYLFIVQELLTGGSLKETLRHPRSQREIAELVAALASALAYANLQGVVHRDLKPANILLDQAGQPYIADFGMALDSDQQLGASKVRCGTTPYMSPQQVAGLTQQLDGRSDIWSLGVVLYELLVGQRPFRGITPDDIYEQIESADPKPLRQIDRDVDPELERICLKCLQKSARDRYLTGDDLADDLQHWLQRDEVPAEPEIAPPPARFIPKGLHSYGREDADFFLELLPGLRDRDGIPASIRFWKLRIVEPVADESRVPVGVIFGPSGSGKSSFVVKAGLLPQLPESVNTVFVEATRDDTEARIMLQLRRQLPPIAEEVSLVDLLQGISRGHWQAAKKVLLVLDQFEQLLSRSDDNSQSQLVKALRYCDGERLQCVLLVRDDFGLKLNRFLESLEAELRVGQNAQMIDLFSKEHARQILYRLGIAYQKLPELEQDLTADQQAFLDQAIEQLASDNGVICVRLTLFAEMFKDRPWNPRELKSVGGVEGVGEKFLEETFRPSESRKLGIDRESVKKVLEALLPEAESGIRGSMQTGRSLMQAAGMQDQAGDFEKMMVVLDRDLHLITATDPDEPGGKRTTSASESGQHIRTYYQLTHDYLVPSIRNWLSSDLGKTRTGRVRRRLQELAAHVVPGQPLKYRPTIWEWLGFQAFLLPERRFFSDNERSVMRAGRSRFLTASALAATILLLAGLAYSYDQSKKAAEGIVENIIGYEWDQTVSLIESLKRYPDRGKQLLESRLTSETGDGLRRARLALYAMAPEKNAEWQNVLINDLLNVSCAPSELSTIACILERNFSKNQIIQTLRCDYFENEKVPTAVRFRAAAALALLQVESDPDQHEGWREHARIIASGLSAEPIDRIQQWIELMSNNGELMIPALEERFVQAGDQLNAYALALALFQVLWIGRVSISKFGDLLMSTGEFQFAAMLTVVEQKGCQALLAQYLKEKKLPGKAQRAVQAVALLRIGDSELFHRALNDDEDEEYRYRTILAANSRQVNFQVLRSLYDSSLPPLVRQGLLMIFAEFAPRLVDRNHIDWLHSLARETCLDDKDPGCFSAAELLAGRLPIEPPVNIFAWRKSRRAEAADSEGRHGDVLINEQLQAFSVLRVTYPGGVVHEVAFATTELSSAEWLVVKRPVDQKQGRVHLSDTHATIKSMDAVYEFCNELSLKNGIRLWEIAYPEPTSDRLMLHPSEAARGFRIPNYYEWRSAVGLKKVADANQMEQPAVAVDLQIALKFSYSIESRVVGLHPSGTNLPNKHGIFDLFGNAFDACSINSIRPIDLYLFGLGGSNRSNFDSFTIDNIESQNYMALPIPASQRNMGIRLVRTLD